MNLKQAWDKYRKFMGKTLEHSSYDDELKKNQELNSYFSAVLINNKVKFERIPFLNRFVGILIVESDLTDKEIKGIMNEF